MDATQAKTRTEKKQFVQTELMHGLSITLGYWQEHLTSEDRDGLGEDDETDNGTDTDEEF